MRAKRKLFGERMERRMLLAAEFAMAADSMGAWIDASPVQGPVQSADSPSLASEVSPIKALDYRLLRLDKDAFNADLSVVTTEPATIKLPRPDGQTDTFTVWQNETMSPELAAQFTSLRTFTGINVAGNGDRLVMESSSAGFHAMVVSDRGNYYIDPFYYVDDRLYASYFSQGDFQIPKGIQRETHASETGAVNPDDDLLTKQNGGKETTASESGPMFDSASSGTELRTYRLAVAATGEYTAFHGGAVADGQAAIATTVNRVNAILESELSIRLQLVANNSLLVYTDAATDPYDNDDLASMSAANQANLDSVIGNGNYDIGHVFGTLGGGSGFQSSVGIDSVKGRGVSSSPFPYNDGYWIQLIAHEMGHQFGANHTFNGDSDACNTTEYNAATAYEPGGGSTLMSYAADCGDDTFQFVRDSYFHSASLDEILNHVDNVIPLVGTRTGTGNFVPVVSAGNDYTIPARTPFALEASGTDANGDPISFSWEQRDLGPQRDLNAGDDGEGPLFRSRPPSEDPTRVFPALDNLLNGIRDPSEQLPTTNRELHFRVTARDHRAGGGAIASDDMQLTVVDTGSAFAVTNPNASVRWTPRTTETVTWNVAGTDTNGINATTVDLLLSVDGGNTFPISLASNVANDGSHSIVVPELPTQNARIKVQPTNNVFFDISDFDFTITELEFDTDLGDAPAPYPVLISDGGPVHLVGGPVLGALVDTEEDGNPSDNATGDGASDDGLVMVQPLVKGQTSDVLINTTTGGILNLFFDFDDNGILGDGLGESIQTTLEAGGNTIAVAVPSESSSSVVARLRLSSFGGLSPVGTAPDGEVEDYVLTVFDSQPGLDFGDASGYATTLSMNGARHASDSGLRLGSSVDQESDAVLSSSATGDGRSDDGIVFRELLTLRSTRSFEANASGDGTLDFFIDFDQDGTFGNHPNEVFSADVSAGNNIIDFDIPDTALPGITYARFRLSSEGGLSASGLALDGEVEDYQIVIVAPEREVLLSDFDNVSSPNLPTGWSTFSVPASLPWTTVSGSNTVTAPNAAHIGNASESSVSWLQSPDFLVDLEQSVVRFQNSHDFETGGYDGGVLEISIDGSAFVDVLDAGGQFLQGGYNGTIQSGFLNTLAGRSAWINDSEGFGVTELLLPTFNQPTTVALRWVFASDYSFGAPGWWIDDVSFEVSNLTFDRGDALGSGFATLASQNGAAHVIAGSDYLGVAAPDAEPDGQPTAAFDGDDSGFTADESIDTVFLEETNVVGQYLLWINHSPITQSLLNIWVDLDQNGTWDDPADHVIKDFAAFSPNSQVTAIPIDLQSELPSGTRATRVRLSSQAGLTQDGTAGDGEVEDLLLEVTAPAPIQVESVDINGGLAFRSQVTSLQVTFDGITSADANAFSLVNRADGSNVALMTNVANVNGKTEVTFTFVDGDNVVSRFSQNSLEDGNYELIVNPMLVRGLETEFRFGNEATDQFFRLFGDGDGDRDVDGVDLGRFGQTFLSLEGQPSYDANSDYDGDGDIDGLDLSRFGQQFLSTMPF